MKKILFALVATVITQSVHAQYIYEKEQWGVFAKHTPTRNSMGLSYTSSHGWAGWSFHSMHLPPANGNDFNANIFSLNMKPFEYEFFGVTADLLLRIGGGHSELTGFSRGVGYAAGTLSFKHRAFSLEATHDQIYHGGPDEQQLTQIRGGVVPGFGKWTGDIKAQFIVEWEKEKIFTNAFTESTTPMIQLAYKTIVLEVGQSLTGETQINYSMGL